VTGPAGHLFGFLADAAILWLRWVRGEARRRLGRPGDPPGTPS
jgi:hypothetical protein